MNLDNATRAVFWHIEPVWPVYVLAALAISVFGWGVYRRARLWQRLGQPAERLTDWPARIARLWSLVGRHDRLFRDGVAGWMHFAVMWSLILLFIGTLVVMIHVDFSIPVMQGWFYLIFQKLILNLAGAFLAAGLVIALIRRHVLPVRRLHIHAAANRTPLADALSLAWPLLILLQGFGLQAIRLAATQDPFSLWSPIGHALALGLAGLAPQTLITAYQSLWWFHLATALSWIAWLPFAKMIHVFAAPVNILAGNISDLPRTPAPIDFDSAERFGISKITDFSWKGLLDLDACTACGRCEKACPAYAAGAPLSPRSLILDLRAHLRTHGPAIAADPTHIDALPKLVGDTIRDDAIWSCTTCSACVRECPVLVEPAPKIIEMRRHLVMEESRLPATLQDALKSLEEKGYPYKGVNGDRLAWCRDLDIPIAGAGGSFDVLYWVGCTASFDPRAQKVARSFVRLLQLAGVRVAILGANESCCGDPARRAGHEFLYDAIAKSNIETLQAAQTLKIVATCAHCFNALGREYRDFGGDFEVMHHTQMLESLVAEGKLAVPATGTTGRVTYHDPCYLGRYNGEFDAPRSVLETAGLDLVEMKRARSESFCCGGGGGQAWMAMPAERPVSGIRAGEALATGAEVVAVSCPFCLKMMEDGISTTSRDGSPIVRDVAELLLEAVSGTSREAGQS